jgi:FlaA1/EpsC-like NDP-sugar epimerase
MNVNLSEVRRLCARTLGPQRPVLLMLEAALFRLAGVMAFALRFDFSVPAPYVNLMRVAVAIWVIAKFAAFHATGLHHRWWRYVSIPDIGRLFCANLLGSGAAVFLLESGFPRLPRSIWLLDVLLGFVLTTAARVLVRILADSIARQGVTSAQKRTLIYGAGAAGIALVRELRQNTAVNYDVRGFVDDSRDKAGLAVHGVRVVGSGDTLADLVRKHGIELILIAIPSASGAQMTRILQNCSGAGASYKTIPSMAELIQREGLATQIRDVAVEDLLGRSPVRLEQERIGAKLRNRTVLVTGAAGSIGSELCRQIARFEPARIVAYDVAETPLFHLEQEMARSFPGVAFCSEIGSVQNTRRLGEVFQNYQPAMVYHAAAYKHVPLMESHVFEAVENNVLGTLNVALAAIEYNVGDFVMISSDKAVRPTNVMGATKRIAELVIRSLQNGGTAFVSVRFGNVLGSNGSVVPIFKQQIARGGPVTVTRPEMRRFFMTIPEASQLVLQSSAMGYGGEIFVLDMGEPVRIVDLARDLILLSGLRPEHDIKVEFTGSRPGEKLFEELNTQDEDTLPTYHEKIKIFSGTVIPWVEMERQLKHLRRACTNRDLNDLLLTMKDVVPEYNPSAALLRRVLRKPEHVDDLQALSSALSSTDFPTPVMVATGMDS